MNIAANTDAIVDSLVSNSVSNSSSVSVVTLRCADILESTTNQPFEDDDLLLDDAPSLRSSCYHGGGCGGVQSSSSVSCSLDATTNGTVFTQRSSVSCAPTPSPSPTLLEDVHVQHEMPSQERPVSSTSRRIRRTLHFIRHGQSETNVLGASTSVLDPALTVRGKQQGDAIRDHFLDVPMDVVFTSTLSRALETTMRAFSCMTTTTKARPAVSSSASYDYMQDRSSSGNGPDIRMVPIVALEVIREVVGKQCIAELRRPRAHLQRHFPEVDFRMVESDCDPMAPLAVDFANRRSGPGERNTSLESRAALFWNCLLALPNHVEHVAVVSHYHFLRRLLRVAQDADRRSEIQLNERNYEIEAMLDRWPNGGIVEVDVEIETTNSFPSPPPLNFNSNNTTTSHRCCDSSSPVPAVSVEAWMDSTLCPLHSPTSTATNDDQRYIRDQQIHSIRCLFL